MKKIREGKILTIEAIDNGYIVSYLNYLDTIKHFCEDLKELSKFLEEKLTYEYY